MERQTAEKIERIGNRARRLRDLVDLVLLDGGGELVERWLTSDLVAHRQAEQVSELQYDDYGRLLFAQLQVVRVFLKAQPDDPRHIDPSHTRRMQAAQQLVRGELWQHVEERLRGWYVDDLRRQTLEAVAEAVGLEAAGGNGEIATPTEADGSPAEPDDVADGSPAEPEGTEADGSPTGADDVADPSDDAVDQQSAEDSSSEPFEAGADETQPDAP